MKIWSEIKERAHKGDYYNPNQTERQRREIPRYAFTSSLDSYLPRGVEIRIKRKAEG